MCIKFNPLKWVPWNSWSEWPAWRFRLFPQAPGGSLSRSATLNFLQLIRCNMKAQTRNKTSTKKKIATWKKMEDTIVFHIAMYFWVVSLRNFGTLKQPETCQVDLCWLGFFTLGSIHSGVGLVVRPVTSTICRFGTSEKVRSIGVNCFFPPKMVFWMFFIQEVVGEKLTNHFWIFVGSNHLSLAKRIHQPKKGYPIDLLWIFAWQLEKENRDQQNAHRGLFLDHLKLLAGQRNRWHLSSKNW